MTQKIRISREFSFEMAHVLKDYDGPCRNIHGHSYRLFVTLSGYPSQKQGDPKNGMVMDFSDLKRIVEKEIINVFDHAVALSSSFREKSNDFSGSIFGNIVFLDYQPTCENLVADFAVRIAENLPGGVELYSLKLYETATSYAEWYASDNQ